MNDVLDTDVHVSTVFVARVLGWSEEDVRRWFADRIVRLTFGDDDRETLPLTDVLGEITRKLDVITRKLDVTVERINQMDASS